MFSYIDKVKFGPFEIFMHILQGPAQTLMPPATSVSTGGVLQMAKSRMKEAKFRITIFILSCAVAL